MILIAKLIKAVSFNLSAKDKERLQQKAKELGIPLARMIRNIVLKKYQNLAIGYITPGIFPGKYDIDIRRLRSSGKTKPITKEEISMKKYVNELKEVFSKGLTILGKMEDSELGIKTEEELEEIENVGS